MAFMQSRHNRKRNGTHQSNIPTSSQVLTPQTRTSADGLQSAPSAPIARSVSQPRGITQITVAADLTDHVDPNSSSPVTHTHAYPPNLSSLDLRLFQTGFTPATERNTLGTPTQAVQYTMEGNTRSVHGTSTQLGRKRTRHSAQAAITASLNPNPSQSLDQSAYRTFASSSSNVVATSEHAYPAHTGASLFSSPNFDYAPHQVSNVASFSPDYAPHFMPPSSYSSQQDLSSDAMELTTERFSVTIPETLDPNGNALPNIFIEQSQQPPSFERILAAFPGMVVPDLQFKADYTEEDPLLATPLSSSHPSEISAFPTLPSPGLTPSPISPSQADCFSTAEDVDTDEESTNVQPKPKRSRKPVSRDKAKPCENKYRKELKDKLDVVGNALTTLPENIKPNNFKGKDGSFQPRKGQVYDGCLHTIETLKTVYAELQQTKLQLAHFQRQQQQQQQQQQHALQHSRNFSVDTKPFHFPNFAQDYSPSMMTQ